MPRKLSLEDIQIILKPHVVRFRQAIWPIWKYYQKEFSEEARLRLGLTAEANILRDLMVTNITQEFSAVSGATLIENGGFFLGLDGLPHGIEGQAACRFKKLSTDGHSQNYLTPRALRIRENNFAVLGELDLPDATIVDIGYVLNPLRTGIATVQAIRVFDEKFIMSIPEEETGTITMPQSLDGLGGGKGTGKRFEIVARKEEDT